MSDTQLKTFEVFHQSRRGEPHMHVGAVHAPDAELALVLGDDLTLASAGVAPAGVAVQAPPVGGANQAPPVGGGDQPAPGN